MFLVASLRTNSNFAWECDRAHEIAAGRNNQRNRLGGVGGAWLQACLLDEEAVYNCIKETVVNDVVDMVVGVHVHPSE